jgi:hypothetical protein
MMKILAYLLLLYVILFNQVCNRRNIQAIKVNEDSLLYYVYKIDSFHNYFIIYARQNDNNYKIVSIKEKWNNCNSIQVNSKYKFELQSIFIVNGKPIIPAGGINELSGWRFNDSTTIDFEKETIRGLFVATNIKGLCYIKDKTQ